MSEVRNNLFEKLQNFSTQLCADACQPGDVPIRPRQAGYEPGPDGIATGRHDNRDRDARLPGSQSWGRAFYDNDIHLEPYKLGGEFRELSGPTPSPPVLESDVLSLDVAPFLQALPECFDVRLWRRCRSQEPYPRDLPCLLRIGERRSEETESQNDREPDQPHAAGESSRTPQCAPACASTQNLGYRGRSRRSEVTVTNPDQEGTVTRASLREYAAVQRERYQHATRAEKHQLLDELVTVTGMHRKAAIRLLRRAPRPPTGGPSRAGRPRS